MKFNEFKLDGRLLAGIQAAGYQEATPIQAQAIPVALQGSDLIGTAQTGTGKTAAFVLPILHKLLVSPRGQVRALIVTPTRELAIQIHDAIGALAKGTGLRSATVFGGVNAKPQMKALRNGTEIIVACPGRLLDLVNRSPASLNQVDTLVLDEADRMFDMGFLPDVKRILKLLPQQRQTMLFSATFPKEIEELAKQTLRNPQRVSMGISKPVHTVSHALYPVSSQSKSGMLLELLERTETTSVLVFTRTKHRANKVTRQVEKAGYRVTSLHGNRSQSQRQTALQGFRDGKFQIMVATDIAARGLDIEKISHVINYDMPDTTDAYIHRIGRTGRAHRTGSALTLYTAEDAGTLRSLERVMGEAIERRYLDDFDYDAAAVPVPPAPNQSRPSRNGQRKQGAPQGNRNQRPQPKSRKGKRQRSPTR